MAAVLNTLIAAGLFAASCAYAGDIGTRLESVVGGERGQARVNGQTFPIWSYGVVDSMETMLKKISSHLGPDYLMTPYPSELGAIIFIAKKKSFRFHPASPRSGLDDTFTISLAPLGDGRFATTGSAGKAILDAASASPAYTGGTLSSVRRYLTPHQQAEYIFGESYSYQFSGLLNRKIELARHDVYADLKASGYVELNPQTSDLGVPGDKGPLKSTWKKDKAVMRLELIAEKTSELTQVRMYEVITR